MKFILIFAVVFAVPLVILLTTKQDKKRGCGRGCATCGNREICHKRENPKKGDFAQKN